MVCASSQLYAALDENDLNETKFRELYDLSAEVSRMISGLMMY